ncbi:hypothetical protein HYPP_01614 [Hyphomicrobium sp. ghe19]|nr:hypothetical protein HYPP_01614 [Hyphomicrobium sp. ghe19]
MPYMDGECGLDQGRDLRRHEGSRRICVPEERDIIAVNPILTERALRDVFPREQRERCKIC